MLGRREYRVSIPESWDDAPPAMRMRWWKRAVALSPMQAQYEALTDLLKSLPRRIRRRIPAHDIAAMTHALRWLPSAPNCVDVPLPQIDIKGITFYLARPKGQNVCCGEFAVCDDLYKLVATKNDTDALEMLTAVLYRQADKDPMSALARGDERAPYYNKDEARARLHFWGTPPPEMQMAALMYFAGLKMYIHKMYGRFIFDDAGDDDDDGATNASTGPQFGWWGTFQQVAEGGVFGRHVTEVYQSFLHEVCVYLVRKQQQADAMRAQQDMMRTKSE